MDLKHLRYFIAVADHNSITKAAEAINLTQPAVTIGIRELEKEVGVPLFDRLPRGMRLNRFGEALYRHAQVVFLQMENAADEIAHLRDRPTTEVRIGAGPIWLREYLSPIIAEMSRRYPEVEFVIRSGFDHQMLSMLRKGEIDFALSEIAIVEDGDDDMVTTAFFKSEYRIVCSKSHPLAASGPIWLDATIAYPWAVADQAEFAQTRLSGLFSAHNLPQPTIAVRSSSLDFIYHYLVNTDALSFVAGMSNARLDQRMLVPLDVELQWPELKTGVIRRKNDWISSVAEEVISEIQRVYGNHAGTIESVR